jgi:hypothetical protein
MRRKYGIKTEFLGDSLDDMFLLKSYLDSFES